MSRLTLYFLGPPLIELGGEPVHLGRHKAVALLAYLALTGQPHSRDALATLLWPELDQSHARGQLRRTLSLLNRTLGRTWLDVDRETAAWAGQAEAWIDVEALRECLTACATHGHAPDQTCAECIPLLEEAVDLYRDGFLAGFTLPDAPAFDEWQFFETEELRDQVAGALRRLARWYGDQGEYESAILHARRWLALDPLHEPAQRELMALYARSGQWAAALRQYSECERVLEEELGVPPSPETVQLYEQIRDHRDPETGFLSETRFLGNLPAQLTPFVGRERELAELSALLAPTAETRLVTVVGPGGMGKTRLALEAASRQLEHYPDGVWFVSLAPVQSAEAIAPTVAQALGLSFFGPDPPDQQLVRYLRGKRMLLVLDNLEHLLEGVDLLVEVLRTAPGVRLLVTSRARLNLGGEQVFVLQGMAYPERLAQVPVGDHVRRYDSVALFARCARRARPTFELREENLPHVARICQLAQGMPLAILLAAAWVPALTPAEIAAEMERSLDFLAAERRDEPQRHHSMRAVFDATWQRLTEKERQVFARLSAFCGGFTREAAEAVAGTDLRTLISLVSKSLLQRDRGGRYEIHELLRQYAEGKLEEVSEEREETLDLHAAYYTGFLARQEMDIWRGYMGASLREIDNTRAAWHRTTAQRRVAEIHRCLYSLYRVYQGPGLLQEGEDVFARAVEALRPRPGEELDEERAAALGLALRLQGIVSTWLGRFDSGHSLFHESLSILRELGARCELALAYALPGYLSVDHLEKSLEIARQLDYYPALETALLNLSLGAASRGLDREAERYAQELLALSKRFSARRAAAFAFAALGHVAFAREDHDEARRCYRESLSLFRAVGQTWTVGRLYSHLGDVAMAVGDYEEAKARHQQALACYHEIGVYWVGQRGAIGGSWGVPVSLQRLGDVALAQGDLAEAERCYGLALEAASDRPEGGLKPHVLLGPAALLARTGEEEQAVEVTALARHHPASVEETRTKADELLERLRSELPPAAYAAAEFRGRARDLETTLHELLVGLGPAAGSEAIPDMSGEVDTGRYSDG
jgi:predicted ATPase/DNA-binding SARP family transcriptional activator